MLYIISLKKVTCKIFIQDDHQAVTTQLPFISHLRQNPGLIEHFEQIQATTQLLGDYHEAFLRYQEFSDDTFSETGEHNLDEA